MGENVRGTVKDKRINKRSQETTEIFQVFIVYCLILSFLRFKASLNDVCSWGKIKLEGTGFGNMLNTIPYYQYPASRLHLLLCK